MQLLIIQVLASPDSPGGEYGQPQMCNMDWEAPAQPAPSKHRMNLVSTNICTPRLTKWYSEMLKQDELGVNEHMHPATYQEVQ
jgi:hypothetical protein